ncbi:hypothetical protein [Niabella hibiscisoli]|uniref:hypothetical protein n=1 Tax=Niabella hibiscisoli TaxID=1825928 RepID=UPI001F0F8CDF|nr:hypothetical protein [Niabella hibiscisoli]MCH5715939.1 hypothetical protein [Niabella hibiscisoli]
MWENVEAQWQIVVLVMVILLAVIRVIRWTNIMLPHKNNPKSKAAYNKRWLIIDRVYWGLTVLIVIVYFLTEKR